MYVEFNVEFVHGIIIILRKQLEMKEKAVLNSEFTANSTVNFTHNNKVIFTK